MLGDALERGRGRRRRWTGARAEGVGVWVRRWPQRDRDRDQILGSRTSDCGSHTLRPGNPTLPSILSRSPPSVRHDCKLRSSLFDSEPRVPPACTRRQYAVTTNLMRTRRRDEGRETLEEFMPLHHDMSRSVAPSGLESIGESAIDHRLETIDRERRPRHITA
jgi:hypothetical protein